MRKNAVKELAPDPSPLPAGPAEGLGSDEALRSRVAQLEALCADVLVASVELGLPQPLLNRLWAAVGHGSTPHAFQAPAPIDVPVPLAQAQAASEPMPLPDIRLTTNPHVSGVATIPAPPATELAPLPVRKTVVVVDDDPMMLTVLERILERENFHLILAGSGPDAVRAIEDFTGPVDLLITDYAMPDMEGRELADRVRQRIPAVKVLYQTGFSDLLFEHCVELEDGAAFVEKPFTARGLREAARLVLFGTLNPS